MPSSQPQNTSALSRGSQNNIEWSAPEYHYREKTADWYWAVVLIALSLAVSAVVSDNVLFAILIVIGTFVLVMYALRRPRVIRFAATERGIIAGEMRYLYSTLQSFWIGDDDERKLIIQSRKTLSPYLIIPLGEDVSEHALRDFLLAYLPEEEHHEPASHKIMEVLGF